MDHFALQIAKAKHDEYSHFAHEISDEAALANARLIAAAPDMLVLLKHLYEHGYTTFADHDRVRDVIAKATGESPLPPSDCP